MANIKFDKLSSKETLIAPSILAADFANLGTEITNVTNAGADLVHVDVMDGHFVPNISIGPPVVKSVRSCTDYALDVHLMISDPRKYIPSFVAAGADNITVHVEVEDNIDELIDMIHESGCAAGLTLRPGTPVETILPHLPKLDLVLVMSVEPGFGGQSFMEDQLEKLKVLRQEIDKQPHSIHLEVDGGINKETAPLALAAGANMLVAGTSVFRASEGMEKAINILRGN